jgi:ubiquitin-protein ligase
MYIAYTYIATMVIQTSIPVPILFQTCLKRLLHEVQNNPTLIVSDLHLSAENRLHCILKIPGPVGSPYSGKIYDLEIAYEASYPFSAPSLRFVTSIFHPNIHPSGRMSNLLIEAWSPLFTLATIYENAQYILLHPIAEYPYNEDAMALWESSPTEFQKRVQTT